MGWQAVPTTANRTRQKIEFTPRNIKEPGYMYVYLSYEGDGTNWVYFDDLKITHTKNNVVQYNEYYPFGLQTSSSWTRENSNNDFLYNEGSELNKTTGWYETPFRNYDAALGRLTSVDPMATKYASFSGYHYAYNNPVMSNDPSGADPESDLQTQFSYMVAMEKLRQELADMARKALLEQYPFYDVSLDPVSAAVYYGMQQEAERQREAALLARARSGDMQAIREYASTHGGLVRYEGAEAQALFSALYSMEEAKLGRRAPAGPPTPSGGQAQQRSANVILNFSNESFTLRGGSGWDLRSVCSMEEATKYLNSLNSAGRKINNLVLIGHGNYEHITLGDNGIIVSNRSGGITTPETLNKLNHMLTEVSIGGNVLIVGCKAGGIFGAALQNYVRNDINVFMNSDYSTLGRYDSDTGIVFGRNIGVKNGAFKNITGNGSSSYQNISLNINGTFNFIK